MVARRVALPVLPARVDAERRDRGVSLDDWIDAPAPPATREECEHAARPCPALRCRFHLGLRGDGSFSCQLDFAELPAEERTYDRIAAAIGIYKQDAELTVRRVAERNRVDNGAPTDERELAERLGIVRRPRGHR